MRTVSLNGNRYYCGESYLHHNTLLYLTILNPQSIDILVKDAKANGDTIYIYEDDKVAETYYGFGTFRNITMVGADIQLEFSQTYNDKEALNILVGERVSLAKAQVLRGDIEQLADFADDETASKNVWAYGSWKTDIIYKVGNKVTYDNTLYKCLQEHTSQETWIPPQAPSLWAKVINEDPTGDIPVWEQPSSTNGYMTGDQVYYPIRGAKIYESLVDNNIWSPTDYPGGWKEI